MMASFSRNQIDLSTIHCCFNWEFMNREQKTELWLLDRIATIEGELNAQAEDNPKRNFPQLYSLQGFLYTQLYLKKENDGAEFLGKAEKAFQNALDAYKEENHGYQAIANGNLIYFNRKWNKNEPKDPKYKTESLESSYNALKKMTNLKNHPEVLAMKGYSANYLRLHKESIEFYQEVLKTKQTAEWVFGLALAKLHRSTGREGTKQENDEIEILLRHAVELDPTYHFVKLKLARHLLEQRKPHGTEEIEDILQKVPLNEGEQKNIIILEEAAGFYIAMNSEEGRGKALELYQRAYVINPHSVKTLRGLGNIYFQKWIGSCQNNKKDKTNKKKNPRPLDESSLENAVKYFTENVEGDSSNAKPFDVTKIGNIHLKTYKTFTAISKEVSKPKTKRKGKTHDEEAPNYQDKAAHHKERCIFWYEKVEERLNKGQFDLRSEIEVCQRLSEYCREFDSERERFYLEQTLRKASQGSHQDNFYELTFVKNARERLLELASKGKNDKVKVDKTKAWIYELSGHFESALFYLRKAKTSPDDFQEHEVSLYFKIIENKRKNGLDIQKVKEEMDILIQQIGKNHFHKGKEFELKSRIIEIERQMSDDNVQELRETFIKFEKTLLDPQLPTNTLADKTFSVLHDSKVVLERAMKYIKEKLYPEGKDFLYYPKAKVSQAEGDLKKFFEKECKWEDFSIRYTEMFAFFVEKLDCNEYSFVLDFVNIRNKGEHDLKKTQLRLFDEICPTKQKKIELTRKSAFYSAEVFNSIKKEVDKVVFH